MEGNAAIAGRARGISTGSGSKTACTLRFKVLNNAGVYPGICNIIKGLHGPLRPLRIDMCIMLTLFA